MKARSLSYLIILMLLGGIYAHPAWAQNVQEDALSYDFRGESLDLVLDRIARDANIDLVYDPDLVRGAKVFKRVENEMLSGLLQTILADHNLDYLTLSSGTIVIVRRVEEAPAHGTLSGIIRDRRTGEPLPGATVMFVDASGGTITGRSGYFSLNKIISGEHTLIFSFVGYEAVTRQIRIPPGQQVRETIELRPQPVSVSPIVVEAHRPQIYKLRINETSGESGTDFYRWGGGPVRDLSIIPGVQSGVPANDITLQGGQESEHRILLDGAPIYSPYSIGRMFSSFSPYAIGSVELYRAGYEAGRGSQIAGLVGLNHELPATGRKGGLVQVDPMSANLRGDLSYSLNEQSSIAVMIALRTNIWSVYRDPVMEESLREWNVIDPLITNAVTDLEENAVYYTPADHQSDLSYHDFHSAVQYKPNVYNTVSFSVYDSDNSLNTAALNRSLPGREIEPYLFAAETYSWKNRMAQLSWNSLPAARLTLESQVSYSRSSFSHGSEIGFGVPNQFSFNSSAAISLESDGFRFDRIELPSRIEGNKIDHIIAKLGGSYSISSVVELQGGIQFEHVQSSLDTNESNVLSTLADVRSSMGSGYSTGSFRFGRYWHVKAGSRLTYLDETNQVYAEPRFSVQVDRQDAGVGYWSGKLSGGLYRQFINEYRISNTGATAVVPTFSIWSHAGTLPVPKAYHLNNSWYLEPSEGSSVRVEAFYKWQPVTSITSYQNMSMPGQAGQTETSVFAETTDMTAAGIGIRYQRLLFESRLKVLAGYDFSYTRVNMETQFERTVSAPWNDPHRAQFRAIWNVMPDLMLMGKWQGIWGRTWAYRDSYYNYLQPFQRESLQSFDFTNPENDRLPHFSQVDLSVVYRPEIGKTNLEMRVDLVNVLNQRNAIDQRLTPILNEEGVGRYEKSVRTMPGFYPSVSIKISI